MFVLLEARIVAAALQLVFAVQLDGRIVVALHGDGGIALPDRAVIAAIPFLLAADVDLQVVEGDVHVALGGVDGDGMLLRLAGDDGVALIFYEVVIALLDVVRPLGVARFHGDVAVGDVPCSRIGRDAGAYHDACDDGGGYAPPECALQSHSLSSSGLFVIREPVFLDANLPKNQEDVNKTCANGGVFGVSGTKGAKPLRHAYGVPPPLPRGGLGIPQSFPSSPEAPLLGELSPKVTERLDGGEPDREPHTQKSPPERGGP